MMRIPFVVNIFCVHLYDFAADVAGLRVPGHVISDFEFPCHDGTSPVTTFFVTLKRFSQGAVIDNNRARKLDPCQLPLPEEREHVEVKSTIESACRLARRRRFDSLPPPTRALTATAEKWLPPWSSALT
jgi:hypothetical protein